MINCLDIGAKIYAFVGACFLNVFYVVDRRCNDLAGIGDGAQKLDVGE